MEMEQYMMHGRNMDQIFLENVVACSCYIVNQYYNMVVKGGTPRETWDGQRPIIAHFKIFGCDAWAHIPKKT